MKNILLLVMFAYVGSVISAVIDPNTFEGVSNNFTDFKCHLDDITNDPDVMNPGYQSACIRRHRKQAENRALLNCLKNTQQDCKIIIVDRIEDQTGSRFVAYATPIDL